MRTISIHLTALAVLIASSSYVLFRLVGVLPAWRAWIVIGLTAGFAAAWLGLLLVRFLPRFRGRPAHAWRSHDQAIMWLGTAATAAMFWLQMPYADDQLQLLVVIFMFGPVVVAVAGSVERAPSSGRLALAPLALPLSNAAYYLVHWKPYSIALALFMLAYGYVAVALRGILQRAVDRAFAARMSAEAALVQVAAERDAKTRFLASASHDLAQPLQAARLSFEQAIPAHLSPPQAAAARRVGWAFDSMEHQLRQMLEHLRLEAGGMEARPGTVALGPLMARLVELHEPSARLAGVDLSVLPSGLAAHADPALLERIVGNLIANAVRHAKARRILVGARRRGDKIRVCIIDNGVGIPPADVARMFDDYVQGSNHGDEIRGGFGLGLASARRMAELMGARVGFSPEWATGSSFWVDLPATAAKATS